MKIPFTMTGRLILTAALTCAALPLTALAGPYTLAYTENNLSGSGVASGYTNGTVLTPSHQEAIVQDSDPYDSMLARGFSANGVVGAHARVSHQGTNSNSGSLSAVAGGSWAEEMDLLLPSQFLLPGVVDHYVLTYSVRASGSVAATGQYDANGYGLVAGTAAMEYDFRLGNAHHWGSERDDFINGRSGDPNSEWGYITGTLTLAPGSAVYLQMRSGAYATVGNFFNFGDRSAVANADFGSTLIWQGIVGVTAFNVSGQEIALPDDFQLDLIGRDTGFNYWNAAVHPDAPVGVPEATPALLLLAPALFGLALVRRRQRAPGNA